MLDLTDPLWKKLDCAHRDRDIPRSLAELAETWDDDEANSLFWDDLCHQETCYGATFAAVPHLLRIAQPETNAHQRREISLFLGAVALCAFEQDSAGKGSIERSPLQGLPESIEAWDQKLEVYRRLVALLEDSNRSSSPYEQTVMLPRYQKVLATSPIDAADLESVRAIRTEFIQSLPEIRALCQRTYEENLEDSILLPYLLSGMAAADGLFSLARLLESGSQGLFACSACGWTYEYILFGQEIAAYAEKHAPGVSHTRSASEDRALKDYGQGRPSRSDGFLVPIGADDPISDKRVNALLALAEKAPSPVPALLLRNFLGRFGCVRCGVEGPIASL